MTSEKIIGNIKNEINNVKKQLNSVETANTETLINVKVIIKNRIRKKIRNIISCDYIDTG